ncbi:MAG: class I SAM-dependent methyltransferase [Desulfobulbaceae bacterium]|nr:class I SAM-dependent methyltransferase [Desulfobulbaceae bacterium]
MNFPSMLIDSGYTLADKISIFMKPGYAGIAYSDGDETENRIANIIAEAQDLSIFSRELAVQCTDWPSLYHLSGTRANILRPFHSILKQANVLEIGAGCGAITRYLGESGANVLALEGSPRRAVIARSRTRDLENVTIVADKFDQFQCDLDLRFDIITLIGVLEYAALFTDDENPVVSMLTRIRELLKPEGRLILAIENQLGLKYFAGAAEDHTGEPMLGIEGRYSTKGPRTFGRKVLATKLQQAGFINQQFMAPFPDYKLPISILTEQGLNCDTFDAAALCWQSARRDPQLASPLVFAPELAWPVVDANGLTLELANSFLVLARTSAQVGHDTSILAYHYSTNGRHSNFCKETLFVQKDINNIELLYNPLSPDAVRSREGRYILFNIPATAKYIHGESLALKFLKVVTRDKWDIKEIGDLLKQYLDIIDSYLTEKGTFVCFDSITRLLPGVCFDIIPQNIICLSNGTYKIIDQEWSLKNDIPLGWILFRTLLQVVSNITKFGRSSTIFPKTRLDFFIASIKSAGFSVTEKNLKEFAILESKIQTDIFYPDNQLSLISSWNPGAKNSFFNLQNLLEELEKHISLAESKLSYKENELTLKNEEIKKIVHNNAILSAEFYSKRFKLKNIIYNYKIVKIIKKSKLFCSEWYIKTYPLIKNLPIEPIIYYLHFGYTNTNPNPYFDSLWYINAYNDVKEKHLNPLVHYILFGAKEGRNPSLYFHTDWYLNKYTDVKKSNKNPLTHFLIHGAKEGRNTNPYFDSQWYKENYPEIEFSGIEPLLHYMTIGWHEGNNPSPYFNTKWYLNRYSDVRRLKIDPLIHYIYTGWKEGKDPNPLFNTEWYINKYPEVLAHNQQPLLNYINSWAIGKKNPNQFFDTEWYLTMYPEVKKNGVDPLIHYLIQGAAEGKNPSPLFNTNWYLEEYHDVRDSGINPLEHYIHYGRNERRRASADSDVNRPISNHHLKTNDPSTN